MLKRTDLKEDISLLKNNCCSGSEEKTKVLKNVAVILFITAFLNLLV